MRELSGYYFVYSACSTSLTVNFVVFGIILDHQATLRHAGNKRYRDLIDSNKETYRISTKEEKTAISRSIVATIRNQQGRFLAERNKLWYDIGDAKATEKTSQALREKPPELRQRMIDDDYMEIDDDDLLDNVDLELAMSDQRYNDGTLNHSEKTYHIAKTLPSNSQQSENNDSYYSSHHHQHQHQHLNPPSFASTNASDSMTNSFDGGTSDSTTVVVSDLMKAQRQIFAALTTTGRTPTTTACIKSEQPHPDNGHYSNQYFEYENENEDESNNREVTLNNDTFEDMMWGDDYNEDDDSDIISLGFLCSVMSSPTTETTTDDPHYLLAIRRTRRWTL